MTGRVSVLLRDTGGPSFNNSGFTVTQYYTHQTNPLYRAQSMRRRLRPHADPVLAELLVPTPGTRKILVFGIWYRVTVTPCIG